MDAYRKLTVLDYGNAVKDVEAFYNEGIRVFRNAPSATCSFQKMSAVKKAISCIAEYVRYELPRTAEVLEQINEELFKEVNSSFFIDRAMLGMLYAVGRTLEDQLPLIVWSGIHPDITRVSEDYFCQGKYGTAVDAAFKEVEGKLRALSRENKGGMEPKEIQSVIGDVFSEASNLDTGGLNTHSGRDYRKGLRDTFKAAFMAYRNPGAHININRTKEEAAELIVLCSHFMFVLDGKRLFRKTT